MNPDEIIISAVGDISFFGRKYQIPSRDIFSSVKECLLNSSLVVANLESPLIQQGTSVPGKCTLHGHSGWARILKDHNIRMVTLANNHIMDFGAPGLISTINSLKSHGIRHAGAGLDRREACAPAFLTIRGMRAAFLARSSVIVFSRCCADDALPGIARLDMDETMSAIRKCRSHADLIIVSLHWGLEEYQYPSPSQMQQAKALIDAGADIILGHHPHVIQGIQKIDHRGIIAYSLGNFAFNDFTWTIKGKDGAARKIPYILSDENRKGIILEICRCRNSILARERFTRIDSSGNVIPDQTLRRQKELISYSSRLNSALYKQWWLVYALHREWDLRIKKKILLQNLLQKFWKVRPRHLRELVNTIRKSGEIASGRTTNPYD